MKSKSKSMAQVKFTSSGQKSINEEDEEIQEDQEMGTKKQDDEKKKQQEDAAKESDEKASERLDEIEQIIGETRSGFSVLIYMVFYFVFVFQIYNEYRITEIYDTRAGVKSYFDQMLPYDLTQIQDVSNIYEVFLKKVISTFYFRSTTPNTNYFNMLLSPLQSPSAKTYNTSEYLFIQNFNYYVGSKLKLTIGSLGDDPAAINLIQSLMNIYTSEAMMGVSSFMQTGKFNFQDQKKIQIDDPKHMKITAGSNPNDPYVVEFLLNNGLQDFEALALISKIEPLFQVPNILNLQLDVYTLNPIKEIIGRYGFTFDISVQGQISYSSKNSFVTYMDKDSANYNTALFGLVMKSLFAFSLLIRIFTAVISRILSMFLKFLSTRIFDFEWDLLIIIIQNTFCCIYVIFWLLMYIQFQDISIPLQMEWGTVQLLDDFFNSYSLVQTFALICFVIIIYEIIKLMNSLIPSFGLLLYTFEIASKDMLVFTSFLALSFTSFVIMANILFGTKSGQMSTLSNSAFFLFDFMGGTWKFQELTQIDPILGFVFGWIFVFFFVLLLIPYFYGVMLNTYTYLREKMQLTTQALAEIAAENSKDFTIKVINLLLFLPPKDEFQLEKERIEKLDLEFNREEIKLRRKFFRQKMDESEIDKEVLKLKQKYDEKKLVKPNEDDEAEAEDQTRAITKNDKFGKEKYPDKSGLKTKSEAQTKTNADTSKRMEDDKKIKKKEKPTAKLSIEEIFNYNWKQLDLFNIMIGSSKQNLITKKIRIAKIQKKQQEIQKRRNELKDDIIYQKQLSPMKSLKSGFLHIIYIVFMILTFEGQTQKSLTYNIEQNIQGFFTSHQIQIEEDLQLTKFKFENIRTTEQINAYITQFVLPNICIKYDNSLSEDQITDFNIIIGTYPLRITYRLYETQFMNFYRSNKDIIFNARGSQDMDYNTNIGSELTRILYVKGKTYNYVSTGDPNAAFNSGGYIFFFSNDLSSDIYQYLQSINYGFLSTQTGIIMIEFVIFNPTSDIFTFISLMINNKGSGVVINKVLQNSFPNYIYSHGRQIRIIYELIVILFQLKYWRDFFEEWGKAWNNLEAKQYTPFTLDRNDKDIGMLSYYLNINFNDKKQTQISNLVYAILMRIYGFTMRFLTSVSLLVQETFFNILIMTGLILMFTEIIIWLIIVFDPFRLYFDVYSYIRDGNTTSPDLIAKFQTISLRFAQYEFIVSLLVFNEIVRVLVYFSFSAQLSLALDIIASASMDIIFFMIMLIIILMSFAYIGVISFGSNTLSFDGFIRSLIKCIEILSGFTGIQMSGGDQYSLADIVFFFSILLIMYFVMMRLFMAILDGHFNEIKQQEREEDRQGIFELIKKILQDDFNNGEKEKIKEKEKERQKLQEEDEDMENQDEEEEGDGENGSESRQPKGEGKKTFFDKVKEKFDKLYSNIMDRIYVLLGFKKEVHETHDNAGVESEDEDKIKIDIQFEDDEEINMRQRLGSEQELKNYTTAQLAVLALQELSGKQLDIEQYKITSSATWVSELEHSIKEVTGNAINLQSYYTPTKNIDNQEWVNRFKPYNLSQWEDEYKESLIHFEEITPEMAEQHIKNFNTANVAVEGTHFMRYILTFWENERVRHRHSKDHVIRKEDIKKLIDFLDNYFFFYLNYILLDKDVNDKDVRPEEVEEQIENNLDISLRNIQAEVFEFHVDPQLLGNSTRKFTLHDPIMNERGGELGQGALIGGLIQSRRPAPNAAGGKRRQSTKTQAIAPAKPAENFSKGLFKPFDIYIMSASQMICCFSKIGALYTIWNDFTLKEKLTLWFGSHDDFEGGHSNFKIYHKIAFWNQAGWDLRTFANIPHLKEDLNDCETKSFRIDLLTIRNHEYKQPESVFERMWRDLQSCKNSKSALKNEEISEESVLPINAAQVRFVQTLLRGNHNYLRKIHQIHEPHLKLDYMQKTNIAYDHKLIIWVLMKPADKLQMIMHQENECQAKFMILMFVEELYDNIIMLSKMEQDMQSLFKNKVYEMYHKFSEFNSLNSALKKRRKLTSNGSQKIEDLHDYILFLEDQIDSTNKTLQSYCEKLLAKIKEREQEKEQKQDEDRVNDRNKQKGQAPKSQFSKKQDKEYTEESQSPSKPEQPSRSDTKKKKYLDMNQIKLQEIENANQTKNQEIQSGNPGEPLQKKSHHQQQQQQQQLEVPQQESNPQSENSNPSVASKKKERQRRKR